MRVTVALAAAGTGIARRTIYEWLRQDRLTVEYGQDRTALVDPEEVLELEGQRRAGRLPRIDRRG